MNVTLVTSASNPQIKDMAALRTPRGRRGSDHFLVEGFNIVVEALRAGLPVVRMAVQNELIESERMRDMLKQWDLSTVPILKVPRGIIKKLSTMETPQGIVAEVVRPKPLVGAAMPETGLSLACECIQDPRNLGLLLRTAHAAGVQHVYLGQGSVDPLHSLAVNSSAGSVLHIPFSTQVDITWLLDNARTSGVETWATAAETGEPLADAVASAGPGVLLLMGNEGAGLSPALAEHASRLVSIPMPGGAESLNIAVAAAVVLFSLVMKKESE